MASSSLLERKTPSAPGAVRRPSQCAGVLWLLDEIERRAEDVIDREIARRLRQFVDRVQEDIPRDVLEQIRSRRSAIDINRIPEALTPFYRHYAFMLKRSSRRKADDQLSGELD
ncbi:MAG: hypothetical protein K1X75_04890 [Leptospirales bacterium]|nr:hypothetical protein [Leptospirales bacterium]